jgi:hypothetical protein
VPIFDELRPLLAEAFDKAEPGTVHVITEHRTIESNLRTHMHRIIRRAGFTPWPKTFQNLRSTRETELFEAYPTELKEICGWLGNSPVVAIKHYMQNRGTAMERATVGVRAAHFQAQSPSVTARHASTVVQPAVALAGEVEACRTVSSKKMPPIGIEGDDVSTHPSGELRQSEKDGGAQTGAARDASGVLCQSGSDSGRAPDLARVVEAWPRLSDEARAAILKLADGDAARADR